MTNQMQCFDQSLASLSESTQAAGPAEISAVALLKLMMRAEASSAAINGTAGTAYRRPEPFPVDDRYDVKKSLSPYLQEQLQNIAGAVFNRVNEDFFCAYKGLAPGQLTEIVIAHEDLRPLAYRALMHEGPVADRPFASRFAESLLLLQKYWHCEFLQEYKDVAGRMSAYSLSRPGRKV